MMPSETTIYLKSVYPLAGDSLCLARYRSGEIWHYEDRPFTTLIPGNANKRRDGFFFSDRLEADMYEFLKPFGATPHVPYLCLIEEEGRKNPRRTKYKRNGHILEINQDTPRIRRLVYRLWVPDIRLHQRMILEIEGEKKPIDIIELKQRDNNDTDTKRKSDYLRSKGLYPYTMDSETAYRIIKGNLPFYPNPADPTPVCNWTDEII